MTKIQIINHSERCSKSKIPIIPILPNKSQAQNLKTKALFWILDLVIILDFVVFACLPAFSG